MAGRHILRFRSTNIEFFGLLLAVAILIVIIFGLKKDEEGGTQEPDDWSMVVESIGVVLSPYTPDKGAPRQGGLAPDTESTIVIEEKYVKGLKDIEKFSHIIVLYAFDLSSGWSPMVKPPWDDELRGVFASRSPHRPNPIGMTVAKLVAREEGMLRVQGMDVFDGTPVLDLKPYIPRFDRVNARGINAGREPSNGK
jgi:tRNA-Thr(GGU) m(6)t(6)A37 methyltransferase TsaA